jgi:hypothetical protein
MRRPVTGLLALILACVWTYASENPQAGTWELNVAKSKYNPGPAPKSGTTKIEAWGDDGVKVTADGVNAEGQTTHVEFQAKYDGKDYPITGSPNADTVSLKRVNPNTVDSILKKGGKEVGKGSSVISKDGKTRTFTTEGTDAQGRKFKNVAVYHRK